MKTATYIRNISGMRGVGKLYRLSEPATYSDGTTEYVVVSKVDHWRATEARRYVERLLGRRLTTAEFASFSAPIRAQHRGAA